MISFGFEDGFADSFKDDFKRFGGGTAFRRLSETTGCMEIFLLAETKAGTGTEAEAGVTLAVETVGTVGVVGTAETEAKVTLAVGIVGIVGIADRSRGRNRGSPRNGSFFLCPAQQRLCD
jgi:hypothetical protein